METISLTIDGMRINCPPGTSLLEAAETHGMKIPTLCHHPDLEPFGGCRLCLVEEEKSGRVMASCVTPAAPGMTVQTATPRIQKHRRNIIRLMIAEHPESCVVCSKGNRCQLRQIAAQLGIGETELYTLPNFSPLEQANPFIIRDLSKCILCGKCIRADHELVVVGAIDYNFRGFKSRPATVHQRPLEESSCTFCGTCVSICPTGALSAKNSRYVGTPQHESYSTCGFCSVGCDLAMGIADDQVIEVNPSHQQDTVNGATLCVRGHFAHDFLNADARLTQPLVRKGGEQVAVSWEEALELVANRLLETKRQHGPQSIGMFGSSKCSNEENYLFQKLARVLLETNNVDNGGYLTGRSALSVLDKRIGGAFRIRPLASLEKSEAIVVLGADPNHSVPVVSYFIKRASRKGVPLVVADPRPTELVNFSSVWLPVLPHSMLDLINGLAAILYEKKAYDASFIEQFTVDFGLYADGLASVDPKKICQKLKLDVTALEAAAELLRDKKPAFIVGNAVLQQGRGVQCIEALINLSLMTGSLHAEAAGIYALFRENNEVGAWDMGAVPDALPGREPLGNDPARKQWERAWKARISPDKGLNVVRLVEEAEKGNLKALYVMGENPLRSLPEPARVQKALESLDFLVVQDILSNEMTQIADVVLPGAAFCEKSGTFTNMEGRIQHFAPAVTPPGEAKPDWEVLDLLASKMGNPIRYDSVEKIRAEIIQFVPMYEFLDGNRQQGWIRQTPKQEVPFLDERGGMIHFAPYFSGEDVALDSNRPFTAILGSQRYHLGSGTRTSHSDRIRGWGLKDEVQVAVEDAKALNLADGDTVRIASPHGAMVRKIRQKKGLRPGVIIVRMGFGANEARTLIGLSALGEDNSLGWKECQVRIEKL